MSDENEAESNVIRFPNKSVLPVTNEEASEKIKEVRDAYVEALAIDIAAEVFSKCVRADFDVTPIDVFKDVVLVVESIKSLMLKTKGIEHPLQDFAELNIDSEDFAELDDYFD